MNNFKLLQLAAKLQTISGMTLQSRIEWMKQLSDIVHGAMQERGDLVHWHFRPATMARQDMTPQDNAEDWARELTISVGLDLTPVAPEPTIKLPKPVGRISLTQIERRNSPRS